MTLCKKLRRRTDRQAFPLSLADALAIMIGIALSVAMAYFARRTGITGDDCFYFSIPQRILHGDRMLVDEWHLTQLSSIFQILPYWLFTKINKSNDGILLFMQYCYIAINLILFFFFYHRFKRIEKPWIGLTAATLFCSDPMLGFLLPNYYNMGIQSIAVFCALLFVTTHDSPHNFTVFLSGIILACSVLIQPGYVVIYMFYCIVVVLGETSRLKPRLAPYRFIVNKQSWLLLTLGCTLVAAAFFTYLQLTSGLCNIIQNLPGLLSAGDYNMTPSFRIPFFLKKGFRGIFNTDFPICTVLMNLLLLCSTVYLIVAKRKNSSASLTDRKVKTVVFVLFTVVTLIYTVTALGYMNEYLSKWFSVRMLRELEDSIYSVYIVSGMPILYFCLLCILLCGNNNIHFTVFFIVAILASIGADFTSEYDVSYAGKVAYFPLLIYISCLIHNTIIPLLRPKKRQLQKTHFGYAKYKKNSTLYSFVIVLLCALMTSRLCFNINQWVLSAEFSDGNTALVESGPYKGKILLYDHVQNYAKLQQDLKDIKQKRDCRVCVYGYIPYISLYLNLPNGAYSTYIDKNDSMYRFAEYWILHPENRPQYIILPKTGPAAQILEDIIKEANKNLSRLSTICTFEQEEKDTCYILTIHQWNIPLDKLEDMKSIRVFH